MEKHFLGGGRMPGDRAGAVLRWLSLAAWLAASLTGARAAELAGVALPDTRVVDGVHLRLNGIGLRTYSIFRIQIYVAGLYLEQRSDDAESILRSSGPKVLEIRFLRDVGADKAHDSWRNGFANNCKLPECTVDQRDVERFISQVPAVHRGDESTLVFTSKGVRVSFDGHMMGDITDTHFAEVVLRTFLGPAPPTVQLKRELLGQE
jgi:hypothetical protein